MTAVPADLDPTRHDHALEAAMTDRIRTADETAAQRPEIPTATEPARLSAGWLRQELDAAYQENARLRGRLITETAERVAAQQELADVRIQRDRLAADHAALTGRHHALGRQADNARANGYAEAIANLRDRARYADWWASSSCRPGTPAREHHADYLASVGPRAAAHRAQELADLRAQLGAAQDALAAIRHGVEHIDRALAGYDTQQPPTPAVDPAEQLVAAHRPGYYQAIDRLLHGWGRYTAWRNSTDYPRPSDGPREVHAAHLAAYLADNYEIPA